MSQSSISTRVETVTVLETINIRMDVRNAFFQQDAKIGYLLSLSLNDQELEADLSVRDPQNPDKKSNAVAVIENMRWEGLPTDPISLCGRISTKNKATMQEVFCSSSEGVKIEAEWVVFEYDYHTGKYFRSFYTNKKPIKLTVAEGYRIWLDLEPDSAIPRPVNFRFEMNLVADKEIRDQKLSIAFSASGDTFSRQIGPG